MNLRAQIELSLQAYPLVIGVDFDGVLNSYSGSKGLGPPIEGAKKGIQELLDRGVKVIVFSARDVPTIQKWLRKYDFPLLEVTNKKPLCQVMLDDRVIRFDGTWSPKLIQNLLKFRPYWEKKSLKANVAPTGQDWLEYYHNLSPVPSSHPPSLKKPIKVRQSSSQEGWEKGASPEKQKRAREDMKEILKRVRRQTGKVELVVGVPVPQYPNLLQWTH